MISTPLRKIKKATALYREKGFGYVLDWMWYLVRIKGRKLRFAVSYPWYRFIKPPRYFFLKEQRYQLFWHRYNATWLNERSVEVPIIIDAMKQYTDKRILEVGNVLSNYFPATHDILDKYDIAPGVINSDAADFHPKEKYDLIVSISTLEHIGFDEIPKDPDKILSALKNLSKNCLQKNGTMLFTFPLGYNPNLDRMTEENKLPFNQLFYLKRTNHANDWHETNLEETRGAKYNSPFPFANVIILGVYKRSSTNSL